MSNHNQIKSIILSLEENYPVDKWIVAGVHLWPNIRFKLYIHLLNNLSVQPLNKDTVATERLIRKKSDGFKKRWSQLGEVVSYLLFYVSFRNIDYLFMGLKMHRVWYQDRWFNRFFDPIAITHETTLKYVHFEMDTLKKPVYCSKMTYALRPIINGYLILKRLDFLTNRKSMLPLDELRQFGTFCNHIQRQQWYHEDLSIEEVSWVRWAKKVQRKSEFFKKFYKKAKIKSVIIASYYGFEDSAAALHAACLLRIPSADFQHGPQTRVHMAYSDWTNLPTSGFNTMPTHYWCWDELSAKNINAWNTQGNAVPLGNTWLQYCTSKVEVYLSKTVLYSLQVLREENLDYFFPNEILEILRETAIPWKLRMHPRSILNEGQLTQFLANENIPSENFEIENPFTCSLIESICNSRLHVTNFSGCLLEAYELGVPTLLIDAVGIEFYEDYIDSKLVFFKSKTAAAFHDYFKYVLDNAVISQKKVNPLIAHPNKLFIKE